MNEPFHITDEERELLERGRQYKQMAELPAWPRLLDFLEAWEKESLAQVHACQSSDDKVISRLVMRWKERAAILEDIQKEVHGTIDLRRQWLIQVAELQRGSQEVQDLLAREEIRA